MLRELRERKELSQPALAEEIHLPSGGSLSTLQHLEWGLRTPSPAVVDELVRVLHLDGEERARFERLAAKTLPPSLGHTLRVLEGLERRERVYLGIMKGVRGTLALVNDLLKKLGEPTGDVEQSLRDIDVAIKSAGESQ